LHYLLLGDIIYCAVRTLASNNMKATASGIYQQTAK
jgi:hypothetical protein